MYRKDGGAPQALPAIDYDAAGQPWTDLASNAEGRAACGWTLAPAQPSYDPSTEEVVWVDGAWEVRALPPAPEPALQPIRVTKIDFSRLFTLSERAALNAAKATIRAMTPTDYADPAKEPLVQLEIVVESFDLPAEFIELDHPDTVIAVGTVLVNAGILTPARAAEVLANTPPA